MSELLFLRQLVLEGLILTEKHTQEGRSRINNYFDVAETINVTQKTKLCSSTNWRHFLSQVN